MIQWNIVGYMAGLALGPSSEDEDHDSEQSGAVMSRCAGPSNKPLFWQQPDSPLDSDQSSHCDDCGVEILDGPLIL